jgi:hypothetical protein
MEIPICGLNSSPWLLVIAAIPRASAHLKLNMDRDARAGSCERSTSLS